VTVQDVANRPTQPAHGRGVGHRPGRQAMDRESRSEGIKA
jgi:hypothetical protein